MLNKLLHRSIAAVESQLLLNPPADTPLPTAFPNVADDPIRHAGLVADLQRLRGRTYLRDGAVEPRELTRDGLHLTPEDEDSWHLVMLDRLGRVSACVWFKAHTPTVGVDQLRVRHCPLANHSDWRGLLWSAVEHELACARREGLGFAELGGGAVPASSRGTSEALVLALWGHDAVRVQ